MEKLHYCNDVNEKSTKSKSNTFTCPEKSSWDTRTFLLKTWSPGKRWDECVAYLYVMWFCTWANFLNSFMFFCDFPLMNLCTYVPALEVLVEVTVLSYWLFIYLSHLFIYLFFLFYFICKFFVLMIISITNQYCTCQNVIHTFYLQITFEM